MLVRVRGNREERPLEHREREGKRYAEEALYRDESVDNGGFPQQPGGCTEWYGSAGSELASIILSETFLFTLGMERSMSYELSPLGSIPFQQNVTS